MGHQRAWGPPTRRLLRAFETHRFAMLLRVRCVYPPFFLYVARIFSISSLDCSTSSPLARVTSLSRLNGYLGSVKVTPVLYGNVAWPSKSRTVMSPSRVSYLEPRRAAPSLALSVDPAFLIASAM